MGLLDDLRIQAQDRREQEEADAAVSAQREQFYREEIQPRMTKAYQFFIELVEHLNYIKPDTRVNYPLFADGTPVALLQGEYTVVIDSSQALKRIDINFQGVVEKSIEFEMFGRDAILRHADRLDSYYIKYERKDRKDTNLELFAAKFKIDGPLPLKIVINADVQNGVIQVVLRNFSDPGVNRYSVPAQDFDDAFLDRLGQFMLRKTDTLFDVDLTMDNAAKEAIRRKLQEEAALRAQELREAEERLKAEEAERLANSKKEQLKNTVLKTVDENKEKLKGIFNKLKSQAGLDSKPKN
jgi:molecular chaperone DnaK (HSP70)